MTNGTKDHYRAVTGTVPAHGQPKTANHLTADSRPNGTIAPEIQVAENSSKTASLSSSSHSAATKTNKKTGERLCIVTRQTLPGSEMLRFVVSPGNQLVPDLKENLPGRGAWVSNSRSLLETAIAKNMFSRSFKQQVKISPDLPELVESLLRRAILGKLALARKAGQVTTGFNKVGEAIRKKDILLVLHATEAGDDGRRQIAAIIAKQQKIISPDGPIQLYDGLAGEELDQVLGNSNITHVAVERGPLSVSLTGDIAKLQKFQGLDVKSADVGETRRNGADYLAERPADEATGGSRPA